VSVRIRMKKMGRTHRPFFRICAMDSRAPRDGKAIEELGYYDPMVADVDARAILKKERIDYWLGVGAQPTPKVSTLIKKYGTGGTHEAAQTAALEKIEVNRNKPVEITPVPPPKKKEEPAAEAAAEGEGGESTESAEATESAAETTEASAEGSEGGGEKEEKQEEKSE